LRILNQVVLTPSDLNFARILCDKFLIEFKEIYNQKNSETFNFHCHQHLVDQVENTYNNFLEYPRIDSRPDSGRNLYNKKNHLLQD
jgi:hypothetical protein